ncbi:MAG TPA: hypothetical protein VFA27_09310 [Vicinamibacterales bacterium]|nr:hypothetical protein [Vicinamibacterales bacterium]
MKTLIKLALAAAITYAAWNAGNAWVTYIKFKDDVEQLAAFGTKMGDDELRAKVLEAAAQRSITLNDDVAVRRAPGHTLVDGSYTQPINVLPWYVYPYTFEVHVSAVTLQGSLK